MVFDQGEFFLLALVIFPLYLWSQRQKPTRHILYRALFYIYLAGVVSQTLFPITLDWEWGLVDKAHHIELELFKYFVWREALLNVLLTLPLGFLYPLIRRHSWGKTLALALLTPLAIELTQLLLLYTTINYYRVVDVSDVFFNFWGVILGYLIYRIILGGAQRAID